MVESSPTTKSVPCNVATVRDAPSGYPSPAYAASLAEFGEPLALPDSGGWLLRRPIGRTGQLDAMGPYPLFSCEDWSALPCDMDRLAAESNLLSVVLVADPFCPLSANTLAETFPDLCRPFKEHHVIDLAEAPDDFIDRHHARNVRYAARRVDVQRCPPPARYLDDWCELYACLVERHGIRGMARFSRESFTAQFDVPGLVAFRAIAGDATVGMALWYAQGDRAYYHLGAYSEAGYNAKASFALFAEAIEHFRGEGLRWLGLGAGAGASGQGNDGLNRFKRGWANGVRPAYLCGRVLNRPAYDALSGPAARSYFPAYREGEFA